MRVLNTTDEWEVRMSSDFSRSADISYTLDSHYCFRLMYGTAADADECRLKIWAWSTDPDTECWDASPDGNVSVTGSGWTGGIDGFEIDHDASETVASFDDLAMCIGTEPSAGQRCGE